MHNHIILLAEAHEPPSLELVDALGGAGLNALVEGLREDEIVPAGRIKRTSMMESGLVPPVALLYEVTPEVTTENLHAVAKHAGYVWPGVPLIAVYHPMYRVSRLGRRLFDHSTFRPLGFHATADGPTHLLALLQGIENRGATRTLPPSELTGPRRIDPKPNLELPPRASDLLPPNAGRDRLRSAFDLAASLHFTNDPRNAAQTALAGLADIVHADRWTIYLSAESNGSPLTFEPLAVRGLTADDLAALSPANGNDPGSSVENQLAGNESKAVREAYALAEPKRRTENGRRLLALPLITADRPFGVLEAVREAPKPPAFRKSEVALLRALASPVGAALANSVRIAEAERLSQTDDLTKLHNARFLRQFLVSEVKRARRYNYYISTLFLDLDDFKQINDKYGHLVGSHVLMEMASILMAAVRDTDVVCRYGGDEFVVVLPETGIEQAAQVAERIRELLGEHSFTGGRRLKLAVTASFGVAVYPEHAASAQQLMSVADVAMYEAKAALKNCIRFASSPLKIYRPERATAGD
jgi:diguanylate cyclase (GGDEF)-like protein